MDGSDIANPPTTPAVLPGRADLPVAERDVLCSRGRSDYAGNRWFSNLLEELRPAYHATRVQREKAALARTAIVRVRRRGGRFLRRAGAAGTPWREMGDAAAQVWARQRLGQGARAAGAQDRAAREEEALAARGGAGGATTSADVDEPTKRCRRESGTENSTLRQAGSKENKPDGDQHRGAKRVKRLADNGGDTASDSVRRGHLGIIIAGKSPVKLPHATVDKSRGKCSPATAGNVKHTSPCPHIGEG